jgi:hypothetical protein
VIRSFAVWYRADPGETGAGRDRAAQAYHDQERPRDSLSVDPEEVRDRLDVQADEERSDEFIKEAGTADPGAMLPWIHLVESNDMRDKWF